MNDLLFKQIKYEVTNLHYRWMIFRNVYAITEEQIKMLNVVDGSFFGTVQTLYWESIILHIARLTDNENMGKTNRNLSLYTLFNNVAKEMNTETVNLLNSKLMLIKNLSRKLRHRRSKTIAHTDYNYGIDKESYELDGISRQDIEDILNITREFMNIIDRYFFDNTTLYKHIVGVSGGIDLVNYLSK